MLFSLELINKVITYVLTPKGRLYGFQVRLKVQRWNPSLRRMTSLFTDPPDDHVFTSKA